MTEGENILLKGSIDLEKERDKFVKVACEKCRKTLLYAEYIKGEIKCSRCGTVNKIEIMQREEFRDAP